ncbi:MAG TPA: SDR family NAD(P)-dependent oxidoreductase [Bryobacteraceae bacterium]|nr:SDR family NAD(P)-dependent oxidoreductase [Bryobacteraceae bacterium]
MNDTQILAGKNVLITGAGRGIGKRLALGMAAQGAKVGLLARSRGEIDLAQLEIEQAGGVAMRLRADVREGDQVDAAVDRLKVHWGPIDVLVCAAGIQGPIGPLTEVAPKAWWDTFETNLHGVMLAARAVLPGMIARRAGKIIALSGGGSLTPRPHFSAYSASKTALVRMMETLSAEVLEHNVQVNCMAPGGAYTSMTDEILAAGERAGWKEIEDAKNVRMTGGVTPEKQIQLALFLASERSNHITGKVVHVNDEWRKLEQGVVSPELYTLRRVVKA